MTRTLTAALAAAAVLAAGCGPSDESKKKPAPKPAASQPKPAPQPVTPQPGPTPGPGDQPGTRTGTVDPGGTDEPKRGPVTEARLGYDVGNKAPEMALNSADGQPFLLSSFRGRQPVLIVFGATW